MSGSEVAEVEQSTGAEDPGYRITVFQWGARRVHEELVAALAKGGRTLGAKTYPKLSHGAMQQLFLAHRMHNELVTVEEEYEEKLAALWRTIPALSDVNDEIVKLDEELQKLAQRASNQAQQRRGKDKIDVALKAELKEKRATLKALRARQRELKAELFPQIVPGLQELRDNRKELIKEIRQGYAARGLYWGTYNMIIDHHNTAVKNVAARRKNGQTAAHKYHRWQGAGTLAVQLQRTATDPVRGPELFAGGVGPWRNVLQFGPYMTPEEWERLPKSQRRKLGRGQIKMRVSTDEHITLPITISRMLPPEADVVGVQLTQRKVARKSEISVAVTARVPRTPLKTTGPTIAVHWGWRVREDGSLRVGTWVSSEALPAADQKKFLPGTFEHNGTWGEITFPAAWREEFLAVDAIRGTRDKNLEQIKAVIVAYLATGKVFAVAPDLTAGLAKMIRSASHIVTLWKKLKEARDAMPADVPVEEDLVAVEQQLAKWFQEDDLLWNREARVRKNLIRRRNDAYRRIAAWLARTAKVLVVDDMDLAQLAKIRETDDAQLAKSRSNRVLAAPGDLRRFLGNAAENHGAELKKASSSATRYTHYVCGTSTVSPEEYLQSVIVRCTTCDTPYDQDVNMGHLLLTATA